MMRAVAYLVNRYPEATLTAIRREIEALENAGVTVHRFAHRPSLQPLKTAIDRNEAQATEYLALAGPVRIAFAALRCFVRHPRRFLRALGIALTVESDLTRAFAYFGLACLLRLQLESKRAAILHVHFGLTSAVVALLARKLCGPPWTVTIHGPEEFEPGNHGRLSKVAQCADRTIAISNWAASKLRAAALPARIEPQVIGMGVGPTFLSPPVPICSAAAIVCIARLDHRKGRKVLLEALSRLGAIGRPVRLELIGDGPCRRELESEISRLGLAESVVLRGWLGESEVMDALDRSSFLVLPSLDEGLPVAIMEAFARARPVIATEVAGIPELVMQGINGLVVPPGDPVRLSSALREFLANAPGELFELGLNGRRIAESRRFLGAQRPRPDGGVAGARAG